MKRFIEGEDRQQVTMLPECLDDYITEDSPVRVVDAFVESSIFGHSASMESMRHSLADPVQRQHRLLLHILDRHEIPH